MYIGMREVAIEFAICFFVTCIVRMISWMWYQKLSQRVAKRREQLSFYYDRESAVKTFNELRHECNRMYDSFKQFAKKNRWKIREFHHQEYEKILEELFKDWEDKKVKWKWPKRRNKNRQEELNNNYSSLQRMDNLYRYAGVGAFLCFIAIVIIAVVTHGGDFWKVVIPSLVFFAVFLINLIILLAILDIVDVFHSVLSDVKRKLLRRKKNVCDNYRYKEHPEELLNEHINGLRRIINLYLCVCICTFLYLIVIVIITAVVHRGGFWKFTMPFLIVFAVSAVLKILFIILDDFWSCVPLAYLIDVVAVIIALCRVIIVFVQHLSYAGNIIRISGCTCLFIILAGFMVLRIYCGFADIGNSIIGIRQLDGIIADNAEASDQGSVEDTNAILEEDIINNIEMNLQDIEKKIKLQIDNPQSVADIYWTYQFLKKVLEKKIINNNELDVHHLQNIKSLIVDCDRKMEKVGKTNED